MRTHHAAMGRRNIFVSRWMAMAWAVGIIWFALEVSSPGETATAANGQQEVTDVTGAPVSKEQVREIESIIKDL